MSSVMMNLASLSANKNSMNDYDCNNSIERSSDSKMKHEFGMNLTHQYMNMQVSMKLLKFDMKCKATLSAALTDWLDIQDHHHKQPLLIGRFMVILYELAKTQTECHHESFISALVLLKRCCLRQNWPRLSSGAFYFSPSNNKSGRHKRKDELSSSSSFENVKHDLTLTKLKLVCLACLTLAIKCVDGVAFVSFSDVLEAIRLRDVSVDDLTAMEVSVLQLLQCNLHISSFTYIQFQHSFKEIINKL